MSRRRHVLPPRLNTGLTACWIVVQAAAACLGDPTTTARSLKAEAEQLANQALARLGEGYEFRIDQRRHIVYVSAADAGALKHVMRLLSAYADAQRELLFARPLASNVTVILPTVRDYRRLVPTTQAHGLYNRRSRVLASLSLSNVLLHEFTHALHHNDMALAGQEHAIWIVEGLATLFQASRIEKGEIRVTADAGLLDLQKRVAADDVRPVAELCRTTRREFMEDAETHYRQSRYVMLYLMRRGKLRTFYQTYKATHDADPTGVRALERTLGAPVDQIDAEWRRWLGGQQPPWRPAHGPRTHLGIQMKQVTEGVEVTGWLRGSQAQRAGVLNKGDVITTLGGQTVRTPRELAAAVRSCQPGQVVEIELIRDGRPMLVKHLLGLRRR